MNRLHEKMVELMPLDEQSYYDREDKNAAIAGNVTGFHIPTKDRQTEEGLAYARMLSDTFSLTPGLLPDPSLAWKDRKHVVKGQRVSEGVEHGGRRSVKKKKSR